MPNSTTELGSGTCGGLGEDDVDALNVESLTTLSISKRLPSVSPKAYPGFPTKVPETGVMELIIS